MKVSEIYEKYKIMPQLQLHMLRVAGVGSLVCDNFENIVDKNTIVSALLIHDVGNVIKFKFNSKVFPDSWFAPQGKKYWKAVQIEFIDKYGRDDYQATYEILKELKVSENVDNIVRSIEFAKATEISERNNLQNKIGLYSDIRVAPFGVTSMEKRLEEVRERYIKNKGVDEKFFNGLADSMFEIEKEIFAQCRIKPKEITEEKVQTLIPELRKYEIKTE